MFGLPYDQEDEAARLLRTRTSGFVAVWSDGSVSWFRHMNASVVFREDAPLYIACVLLSDKAARRQYVDACRRHHDQSVARAAS